MGFKDLLGLKESDEKKLREGLARGGSGNLNNTYK